MRSTRSAVLLVISLLAVPAARADDGPFIVRQRQTRIVTDTPAHLDLEGVRWGFLDHDLEKPVFKPTRVLLDHLEHVEYWSEPFDPQKLLAHGLIVFLMKDLEGVVAPDGSRDIGIAMSVEVHYKVGQPYKLINGLRKVYRIIYQSFVVADRLQWCFQIWKEPLRRYRLKLDDAQKRALLRNTFAEAAVDRRTEWYHAVTNSCVGNAARVMNTVLPPDRQLVLWYIPRILFNMSLALPNRAPGYMIRRGVAGEVARYEPGIPFIEFPLADGSVYRVDFGPTAAVQARPANEAPIGSFAELAIIGDQLQRLQDAGPDVPGARTESAILQREAAGRQAELLEAFEADLEGILPAYLDEGMAELPVTRPLDRQLLRRVNAGARSGALPAPLVERARRELSAPAATE